MNAVEILAWSAVLIAVCTAAALVYEISLKVVTEVQQMIKELIKGKIKEFFKKLKDEIDFEQLIFDEIKAVIEEHGISTFLARFGTTLEALILAKFSDPAELEVLVRWLDGLIEHLNEIKPTNP